MSHHLSPALVQLKSQVNAHFPRRDKASDGWIGDVAHGNRVSDHNPDADAGGIVRAIDVDEDLDGAGGSAAGPASDLVAAIITDPRTAYVIYEGRIWQNPTVFPKNPGWRKYTGVNSHAHHVHVSVRRGATWDRDGSPWPMPGIAADITPTPSEEDDMFTDQDRKDLAEMKARILGALPGKENGRAEHPRVLDTGDGAAIVQNLGFVRNQLAEFTRSVVNAAVATVPSVDQEKVAAAVEEAATKALVNIELTFSAKR